MIYRKLKLEDYNLYFNLREKALNLVPEAFASTNTEELKNREERFKAIINHEFNFIMGAFDKNDLIGMTGFIQEEKIKLKHKGFIWGMFVNLENQGQGIGKYLLQSTLNEAFQNQELKQINLGVVTTNQKAIQLYESKGFIKYGVEKNSLCINSEFFDEFLMYKERTV